MYFIVVPKFLIARAPKFLKTALSSAFDDTPVPRLSGWENPNSGVHNLIFIHLDLGIVEAYIFLPFFTWDFVCFYRRALYNTVCFRDLR
jgi:hypothetical protein